VWLLFLLVAAVPNSQVPVALVVASLRDAGRSSDHDRDSDSDTDRDSETVCVRLD